MPINLSYEATLRTARTLASHANINLVFENKDMGLPPRTDGKTIFVPKPSVYATEDELLQWQASLYHEIRHNWPEFRGSFDWLKRANIPSGAFVGTITNCLEDYKIEHYMHDLFAGERAILSQGHAVSIRNSINRLRKAGNNVPEQAVKFMALLGWDCGMREGWQFDLRGFKQEIYELLPAKGKEYMDKLDSFGYASKIDVPYILDNDEQYEIAKDILLRVFETTEEQDKEEAKAKQQAGESGEGEESDGNGKKAAQRDGEIKWEEMQFHSHDRNGPSYSRLTIDYSGHKRSEYSSILDKAQLKRADEMSSSDGYERIAPMPPSTLGGSVLRLLQVRSRDRYEFGQQKGRLAGRSLHRITCKHSGGYQTKLFKQKRENYILDTSVSVLCDLSGSMGGDKYEHAAYSAMMLNEAIAPLGVPLEILGFSTTSSAPLHVIFKEFSNGLSSEQLRDYFQRASHWMHGNADGESILWAYSRLIKQRTKRKILIVLSDGQPSCTTGGDIYSFTQDVVKEIEGSGNAEIYGLGIIDKNVQKIYKEHGIIQRAEELESKLLDVIKTKIIG